MIQCYQLISGHNDDLLKKAYIRSVFNEVGKAVANLKCKGVARFDGLTLETFKDCGSVLTVVLSQILVRARSLTVILFD